MNTLSTELFFARAAELNVEKICAFAVLQSAELFDFANQLAVERAKEILENPLYKEPIELRSEIVDKYLNNNKEILKDFPKVFE